MSQDKPGLSNEEFIKKWRSKLPPNTLEIFDAYFILGECLDRMEALIGQGKPTPGQIGAIDGDKLVDFLTTVTAMSHEAWQQVFDEIDSGRFSVTGQGSGERDYTPEEALAEARRRWGSFAGAAFATFRDAQGVMKTLYVVSPMYDFPSEWRGDSFRAAFASADKARAGKEDG